MYQPLNADVNLDLNVKVVPLGKINTDITSFKGVRKDLIEEIKSLMPEKIEPADGDIYVQITNKNAKHIGVWPGKWDIKTLIPIQVAAIRNLKDLIKSAVLIETLPNMKEKTISSDMNRSQIKSQLHKNSVEGVYRLYVPVTDGSNIYIIRLVAEKLKSKEDVKTGEIIVDPKRADLYDVILEEDATKPVHPAHSPDTSRNLSDTSEISVRDMLRNVKDYNHNPYINKDGSGNFKFAQSKSGAYRGYIDLAETFGKGEETKIVITPDADASTVIHESAHFYFAQLRQMGQFGPVEDLEKIRTWCDHNAKDIARQASTKDVHITEEMFRLWLKDAQALTDAESRACDIAMQEYFARSFEAYFLMFLFPFEM